MWATDVYCGERQPEGAPRLPAVSNNEKTNSGKPRTVIIEDEFFVAWDLQSSLRDLNFTVCEIANNAESAVETAINYEAELLLADVNLGGGPDGIEAVRRIREYRHVAVVFITAYTDETNLKRIRAVAPDALILSKPVSIGPLISTIKKLFPRL